jgi:hypothetical protein
MNWNETIQALQADGEKLHALTGEDHGPWGGQHEKPKYGGRKSKFFVGEHH